MSKLLSYLVAEPEFESRVRTPKYSFFPLHPQKFHQGVNIKKRRISIAQP